MIDASQNFVIAALLAIAIGFFTYNRSRSKLRYWKKSGVAVYEPAVPFLSAAYEFWTVTQDELVLDRRKKLGRIYVEQRFGRTRLVVADPEVVREICIKYFENFPNHETGNLVNDYQKNSLFWIRNEHWKRVRTTMSPTFTSGKIKRMFKLMDACADDLVENFREQYERAKGNGLSECQVDLRDTYSMYTMDGIATCCYGIKLRREQDEALSNDPNSASRESFAKICSKMLEFSRWRVFLLSFTPLFLLELFQFQLVPNRAVKPLADRVDRMIEMRRRLQNQPVGANSRTRYDDLLQLLVDVRLDDKLELNELDQLENHHAGLTHESLLDDQERFRATVTGGIDRNSNSTTTTKLSDIEILSEAMFLLAAGLDTTRASLSSITYFLAHNPNIQERLYEEIKAIAQYNPTADGKKTVFFDYEALTSCAYLDAVISEGLRRFSPVVAISREAVKDHYIEKYKLHVPAGTYISLGFYSMHMDSDYWDEPEKFDPDRFMPGRKEKIVPGSYSPFSMGPRHCFGMRFSLTETKLGLAKALMNFVFKPAPGTRYPPIAAKELGIMTVRDCKAIVEPRG